jgi:hypothetical protein
MRVSHRRVEDIAGLQGRRADSAEGSESNERCRKELRGEHHFREVVVEVIEVVLVSKPRKQVDAFIAGVFP